MALAPSAHLCPYEVTWYLGSSGMSLAHEARDPRLDRRVAAKLLPPGVTTDDTATQRFLQAAQPASASNPEHALAVGVRARPCLPPGGSEHGGHRRVSRSPGGR